MKESFMTVKVTFVCLGNICRSPMADGVFQKMVDEAGLPDKILVDSAGTSSYHIGEVAHKGTRQVLTKHDIVYNGRSRQISTTDNSSNTYLIALDESNLSDLNRAFGKREKTYRLLDFASQTTEKNVPDPYYSGGFDYVYELIEDGCAGLLAFIRQEEGI
jgi:protein-tyrosine phosphatase